MHIWAHTGDPLIKILFLPLFLPFLGLIIRAVFSPPLLTLCKDAYSRWPHSQASVPLFLWGTCALINRICVHLGLSSCTFVPQCWSVAHCQFLQAMLASRTQNAPLTRWVCLRADLTTLPSNLEATASPFWTLAWDLTVSPALRL